MGHDLNIVDTMNNLGLWLTWTTLDRELKAPVTMNNWVVDTMGYSWLWAQGSKCYEQCWAMVDMNDSMSWAQGSRCYE